MMGAFGFWWLGKDISALEAMLAKTKDEEEAKKIRERIEEMKKENEANG